MLAEITPYFNKSFKIIRLIGFIILLLLLIQKVKDHLLRASIIHEAFSRRGEIFHITDNIKRISDKANKNINNYNIRGSYKLVYEIDVDCFVCLEKLQRINFFVKKAENIKDVSLLIITAEKSLNYVEYRVGQVLPSYDIWVAQQEIRKDAFDIYLLDKNNKIVIAGDFICYPFLEDEYIKCLLKQ